MTSGEFTSFPIDSISVNRSSRQRRELVEIESLAESIRSLGLIHPIVITREGLLVAGERRLTAVRSLGWTDIPVQFADTLDPTELHILELEENVRRVDLSWVERTRAVEEYHRMKQELNPEHSIRDTASALGITETSVYRHVTVADEIKKDSKIAELETFSAAHNLVTRKNERAATAVLRAATETSTPFPQLGAPVPLLSTTRFAELLNIDFLDWSATPQSVPFNLIHCDFPYGVSTGDKKGQSAAKTLGTYDDGADVYWTLLQTLLSRQDNFIAPSAHMMFWFSMNYYTDTKALLEKFDWVVNPTPLIWAKSDNAGIIPDPNRGPRQIYETALLCSRGDRKIVRPVANVSWCATTKEYHTSEKSLNMLQHFFRMLVDESTRMLDPTCGSGMSVKAAEDAGAAFSLGLERDLDFYTGARHNLGLEA